MIRIKIDIPLSLETNAYNRRPDLEIIRNSKKENIQYFNLRIYFYKIKHVQLAGLYNIISIFVYRFLKKLYHLSYLDVHGGYIDPDDLRYVQENLGARVEINKFKFSSVARPTVGLRRSSIWNMRVRDID